MIMHPGVHWFSKQTERTHSQKENL